MYLKLLKNAQYKLTPFSIALLLLIARGNLQSSQIAQIYDFIKVSVQRSNDVVSQKIPWLASLTDPGLF